MVLLLDTLARDKFIHRNNISNYSLRHAVIPELFFGTGYLLKCGRPTTLELNFGLTARITLTGSSHNCKSLSLTRHS